MESMLAAYGSGAAKISHDRGAPLLNIDIGGGTTKLALVEAGTIVQTAAIHMGGRLAVVDGEGCLTRLDPAGGRLAALAGRTWSLGERVSEDEIERVAEWMADALVTVLTGDPVPSEIQGLWLTDPLSVPRGVQGVMFSGGVGEYVYGREERDFGDLGRRFGHAIRQRLDSGRLPLSLLPAGECIRATAVGASEYSVQLSGNTVYLSSPGVLLPRRNLQVIQPPAILDDTIEPAAVATAIRQHFGRFDLVEGESDVALAFRWSAEPTYRHLSALARGIIDALPRTLAEGKPLFVILDADIAHTLGTLLKEELGVASEVLVLDGIALWDFDYIDLGRVRMPSFTVPVTIKSLVFSEDPRVPHRHHHDHAHSHGHSHAHSHTHDHTHDDAHGHTHD
jgi:ethanolamine utilization protein EutA